MPEPLGLTSLLPQPPDSLSLGPAVYWNTSEAPASRRFAVEHTITRWCVA